MKYLALLVLLFSGPAWGLLTWVHERNAAVAAGKAAYARSEAAQAATAFAAALKIQAQRTPDPRLLLNLAHAQAQAGQLEAAHATYGRLLAGSPAPLGSIARQQLAVLAARQKEIAQAISLLRQALLLNPRNSGARFDYEVLSTYLAKRPNAPKISAPPKATAPLQPKPVPDRSSAEKNQPAEKSGTDHQGETSDSKPAPAAPDRPSERHRAPAGQLDNQLPNASPGNAATGGRRLGPGSSQPVASGETPGSKRGLDRGSAAPGPAIKGPGNRPGADAAAPADTRLQTQRERLQSMNLSPAQARQLLETLRAQEQQYLQQLPRPAPKKPDPSLPTW